MPETIRITTEAEADGRWIAEIEALPGALAYGATREDAIREVKQLAARIVADRLAHGEPVAENVSAWLKREHEGDA